MAAHRPHTFTSGPQNRVTTSGCIAARSVLCVAYPSAAPSNAWSTSPGWRHRPVATSPPPATRRTSRQSSERQEDCSRFATLRRVKGRAWNVVISGAMTRGNASQRVMSSENAACLFAKFRKNKVRLCLEQLCPNHGPHVTQSKVLCGPV